MAYRKRSQPSLCQRRNILTMGFGQILGQEVSDEMVQRGRETGGD